jgi:hypothetical protein
MPVIAQKLVMALAALSLLSACGLLPLNRVNRGSERVRIVEVQETRGCKRLGKLTLDVSEVMRLEKQSAKTAQQEINRLARDKALEMEGDTLVPLGSMVEGEQGFHVFRCAKR